MLIVVYLAAIVAANLTVAAFGPSVSIINAFLLIGLDLSTRDALHERWQHRHLLLKMAALVTTGSVLSWLLNRDAGRIALASAVAFGAAAVADTAIYHLLRRSSQLRRMNGSNSVSAAVDSILFPTIAFGGFLPWITLGQYVAKVGGGAVWAWLLNRKAPMEPEPTTETPLVTLISGAGTILHVTRSKAEELRRLFPGVWTMREGVWGRKD